MGCLKFTFSQTACNSFAHLRVGNVFITFLPYLCKWLNWFCLGGFFAVLFRRGSWYKRINIFLYDPASIATTFCLLLILRFLGCIFLCFYKSTNIGSGLSNNSNNAIYFCCFSGFNANV